MDKIKNAELIAREIVEIMGDKELNLSIDDVPALSRFIDEVPECQMLIERLSDAHYLEDKVAEFRTENVDSKVAALISRFARRRRLRTIKRLTAIAASIIVVIVLGLWQGEHLFLERSIIDSENSENKIILLTTSGDKFEISDTISQNVIDSFLANKGDSTSQISYNTIKIPFGCRYQFTLCDGTRVWLNANSELRFPTEFPDSCREVSIKGDGYFEVVHDVQRPFIVTADDFSIRVLGTRFGISSQGKSASATLLSGSIRVNADNTQRILTPGTQVTFDRENRKMETKTVNAEMELSWVTGVYLYEDKSLKEIVECLENWYGVEFVFESEETATRRFTGVIRYDLPLEKNLSVISKTTNIKFGIEPDNNVIKVE